MKKSSARPTVVDRTELVELGQLPNFGPAVATDLRRLGVTRPQDLIGRDPYAMFDELCRVTGRRPDPCMLDTFIAVVRLMGGEPAKPWWEYTAERKRRLAAGQTTVRKK